MLQHKKIIALKRALEDANNGISSLPSDILTMDGLSGIKTRHFYNNALKYIQPEKYLEVGMWKGSSFISAMYKNNCLGIGIDNWSGFGGPSEEFHQNVKKFLVNNEQVDIRNGDCFSLSTLEGISGVDYYMYDGDHTFEDQRKALTIFLPLLADEFVFVVDDWNWEPVREGTFAGLREINVEIVWSHEIRTTSDNSHPPAETAKLEYWNGMAIFLLVKRP
jgi:hypothetical protein